MTLGLRMPYLFGPLIEPPVQKSAGSPVFDKSCPVQPVLTGLTAWTVFEANRTAGEVPGSGSGFFWSNRRAGPVFLLWLRVIMDE